MPNMAMNKRLLVDADNNPVGVNGNPFYTYIVGASVTLEVHLDAANDAVLVYGYDGSANQKLKTDSDGHAQVDVLTVPLPSGAATSAKQDAANALLGTIDADISALAGTVSGSEVQVDIVSSALPTGAATETTLAAIETVISDVDMGAGVIDAGTQRVTIATDDTNLAALNKSLAGASAPTIDSYANAAISAAAATANQTVIAQPGANKQIWVYGYHGTADTGDGSISFQDEDDTAISGVMEVKQYGGLAVSPSGNFAMPIWKLATNKALEVDTVTCGFKGSIQYAIVSV